MQNAAESKPAAGFTTLLKESDGGPKKGGELVIQSETEWKAFCESLQSDAAKKKLLAEKIDFSKETVVAIAENNSSILGELYEHESGVQKVTADKEGLVVEYNTVHSDHLDTKSRYRFHVIKAAKGKKVTFKPTGKVYAG